MESENNSSETSKMKRLSIFDDPVDLFNFNQIQPAQSSSSYAKMIQASRSVPGSRRNSNEDHGLDLLLGKKLSLNDSESEFSRKLPFAMTTQEPIGTYSQKQRSLDLLPHESEIPPFNPILSQANESPIRAATSAISSTSDDYAELFTMTNINNVPATSINGPTNSIAPAENNTSWIPYHTDGQITNPVVHGDIIQQHQRLENARRYSYGWHTPSANHPTGTNRLMSNADISGMKFTPGMYPISESNKDLSQVMCMQFQQFGFCPRIDVCPFAHLPPSSNTGFFSAAPPTHNLLYQQYTMLNRNQHQKPPPLYMSKSSQTSNLNNHKNQHLQQQQQRRTAPEQQDRFSESKIDDFVGKLYDLCKDQNGCRFLQKKIEETEDGDKNLEIVFKEIHSHFTELMTDPFGNYLCQKMLEKCNDEQRTIIVETVAPELVKVALNMHGTRAVQKLIEYLSTPQQIKSVTASLNSNVVTLIKDLNGNHVIQKCLHRLSAEDNQFIYDAVCANCIQVASHKHGCCVLQRCFDHATVAQKDQLVNEIARHALPLVQNPFGNYVVQYVLELGVSRYSESVIRRFVNHVYILSVQKFSSNVIENCIRTAQAPTRRLLIAELVNQPVMEKLLHDQFANYVVQTSLDFAEEDQRAELVECIRPLLPTIRTTPYGKRIHSKIFRDANKTQFTQQRQRHRQYHDFGNLEGHHSQPQQNQYQESSSYQ